MDQQLADSLQIGHNILALREDESLSNLSLEPLPSGRMSSQQFLTWKNNLLVTLLKSRDYALFLPGGYYSTWNSLASGDGNPHRYITQLHPNDLITTTTNIEAISQLLLAQRNTQLFNFLNYIAVLDNDSSKQEICQLSTGIEWVFNFLEKNHCSTRQSLDIFDLNKIECDRGEDFRIFYLKFRALIFSQLKKKGDVVEYLNGELLEDEILSPTFEEIIVLWCLEKIDPNLPEIVKRTFSGHLSGNTTLKDLQEEIFKVLPILMTNIESKEGSLQAQEPGHDQEVLTYPDQRKSDYVEDQKNQNFENMKSEGIPQEEAGLQKQQSYITEIQPSKQQQRVSVIQKQQAVLKQEPTTAELEQHKAKDVELQHQQLSGTEELQKQQPKKKVKLEQPQKERSKRVRKKNVRYESDYDLNVVEPIICDKEEPSNDALCLICQKQFASKASLRLHMDTKHTVDFEKNVCDFCGKTFPNKRSLNIHNYQMHEVTFHCGKCSDTFTTRKAFKSHMKEHDKVDYKDTVFTCPFCNKSFVGKEKLDNHFRHHKYVLKDYDERYVTALEDTYQQRTSELVKIISLGRTGAESLQLVEPVKEEENPEDQGDISDFIMTSVEPSDLVKMNKLNEPSRIVVHPREKKYSCKICDAQFYVKANLKKHEERHKVDKLVCTICNEKFTHSKLLSIHKNRDHATDDNDKTFPCEVCGKLFKHGSHLKAHLRIHSEEWNKFRCEVCSRSFSSLEQMGSHICKHYSCDICNRQFIKLKNLQNHKRLHNGETMYECDSCEACFDKRKRLNEHKKFAHLGVKKFSCDYCYKAFAMKSGLNAHILVHTGEKPFKCDDCGQSFRQRGALDTHKKLHLNILPYECEECHAKFRMASLLKLHKEGKRCGIGEIVAES